MNHANNAVAALVFIVDNGELKVLLAKRRTAFAWELPVQLANPQESLTTTLDTVIKTITGVSGIKDVTHTLQLHTYDATLTEEQPVRVTTYLCMLREPVWRLSSFSIEFFPVRKLPTSLARAYKTYVDDAVTRLQDELLIAAMPLGFLAKNFTMSELHIVYEAVLERKLDRRNFQKKIESLELVTKLPHAAQTGAHRPAALYSASTIKPYHRLPRVMNW